MLNNSVIKILWVLSLCAILSSTGWSSSKVHKIASSGIIIDTHLHALPPEMLAAADKEHFGVHAKVAGTMVRTPEELAKQTVLYMDKNNISLGVLSGVNEMVQQWTQAYPGRFIPSFTPDPSVEPAVGAKQFAKEIDQGKWKALGEITLPYAGKSINDPALFPYYEVCEKKGIPVIFHAGLDGPKPQTNLSPVFAVSLGNPLLLVDVVNKFPNLKVIIAHMGWPYTQEALYMLYSYPNIYLDTAAVDWLFPSLTL